MNRVGARQALAAMAVIASAGSCTTTEQSPGLCAANFSFDGRVYFGMRDLAFDPGDALEGPVGLSTCDQISREIREAEAAEQVAYEVPGLGADEAVAIGPRRDDVRLYVSRDRSGERSPELRDFIRQRSSAEER